MNKQKCPKNLTNMLLYKEVITQSKIKQLKISSDSNYIIIGDNNGSISFYDTNKFLLLNTFNFGETCCITTFTEIKFLSPEKNTICIAIGYPRKYITIIRFFIDPEKVIKKYEVIQNLTLANDTNYVQHIIEARNNKLISGDYNNIIITKYEEKFDIEKIIPMKHVVDCIIDINDNLFAACQYYFKCVKFLDKKSYKIIKGFYDINVSTFCNNILKLIKDKILIVCCENGFVLFDIENLQIIQKMILKNKVHNISNYINEDGINYFLCGSFIYDKGFNYYLLLIGFDGVEIKLFEEKGEIHENIINGTNYITEGNIIITCEEKCFKCWKN